MLIPLTKFNLEFERLLGFLICFYYLLIRWHLTTPHMVFTPGKHQTFNLNMDWTLTENVTVYFRNFCHTRYMHLYCTGGNIYYHWAPDLGYRYRCKWSRGKGWINLSQNIMASLLFNRISTSRNDECLLWKGTPKRGGMKYVWVI